MHECSWSAPCDPLKREPPWGTGTRVASRQVAATLGKFFKRNVWRLAAPANLQKSRARDWTSRGIILSTWAKTHHQDLEVEAALADSSACCTKYLTGYSTWYVLTSSPCGGYQCLSVLLLSAQSCGFPLQFHITNSKHHRLSSWGRLTTQKALPHLSVIAEFRIPFWS